MKKSRIFAPAKPKGTIAQLVEQRTENPCVPGSIPGGTTSKNANNLLFRLLAFLVLSFAQHLHNSFIRSSHTG